MKSGLHHILFHKKDLNLKLQYSRGAQNHSYVDVLILEQPVEVIRIALVYFAIRWWKNCWSCEQTPSYKFTKTAVAQSTWAVAYFPPPCCPQGRLPAWSLRLAGDTDHAPLLVSASVGEDLSLAFSIILFQATSKGTRRGVEWCKSK